MLGIAPLELLQPPPPRRPETPSSIPQTASPGPSCSSEVRFTCALPATLSGGIASPRRYPRSRSFRAVCRCFTLSDLAPSWLGRLSLLFGRGFESPHLQPLVVGDVSRPPCSPYFIIGAALRPRGRVRRVRRAVAINSCLLKNYDYSTALSPHACHGAACLGNGMSFRGRRAPRLSLTTIKSCDWT